MLMPQLIAEPVDTLADPLRQQKTQSRKTILQSNARIMVVEDEGIIRFHLIYLLEKAGYTVTEATTGADALELVKKQSYDLMLLDIMMPQMSGLEVVERLQQSHTNLPVIILTANAALNSAIFAAKTDIVVDYLLKPIDRENLLEAIEQALHKRAEQRRQQQLVEAAGQVLHAIGQSDEVIAPDRDKNDAALPETVDALLQPISATGHIKLDGQKQVVTIHDNLEDQTVELTKGETAILTRLMQVPNKVLSCRRMVYTIWGYTTTEPEAANIIRPYICRLRKKIEKDPKNPQLLQTVRRRGYRFVTSEM